MTHTTYCVGGYYTGEQSIAMVPEGWLGDGTVTGIVYCHGYGADALSPMLPEQHGQFGNITALVAAGFPVLAADLGGGSTFGNDTVIARITDAITYLHGTIGARQGKVVMFGTSMGGCNALAYAGNNPTSVFGVVAVAPVSDLQHVVDNNDGGLASAVNGCYLGGYSDATYGNHNPQHMAASGMFTMPVQLWQGSADTTVIPATVSTLAKTIGSQATLTWLPNGHSENTWATVDSTALIKFVQRVIV